MRTGAEFSTNVDGTGGNRVLIEFERIVLLALAQVIVKDVLIIVDFYITEAPIQIPEDKGINKI